MYNGGTLWNYIQAKNRASRAEGGASGYAFRIKNFEISFSTWLKEGEKINDLLEKKLKEANLDISDLKNLSEKLVNHMRSSTDLLKELH